MSPSRRPVSTRRRLFNHAAFGIAAAVVVAINATPATSMASTAYTAVHTALPSYKQVNGDWQTLELPSEYAARSIHAALLHTGKVLLIAGSGNSASMFEAGTFETLLWDPVTGDTTSVPTPEDLFCGGHAYLPNGNLLIAGGTRKYEVLREDVTNAAGSMTVKNETTVWKKIEKGDRFLSSTGLAYVSTESVVVPPAHEMPPVDETADPQLMAGAASVWVEAEVAGPESVVPEPAQYAIEDLSGEAAKQFYGLADFLTLDKQNYRGLDASYEFDVESETYIEAGKLDISRWYPTLVSINGGNVLAVSGLDQHGNLIDGNNEVFERSERDWFDTPALNRNFPTYPHLFRLQDGRLFFSGANTGYGNADVQYRQSGIWDLTDNSFDPVGGMREPEMNETASSFLLPPVQSQRAAIVGGGEVGDGPEATNRFDVVDLSDPDPQWEPAVDYPSDVRYLNAVTLPDDTVLLTNGSSGYRGNGNSDLRMSRIYDPETGELREAAPNTVGRNYHSTALLLPDGRVMTMGSDPLFEDVEGKLPGQFETRVEIFTPPYLLTDTERPVIHDAPAAVKRGTTFHVHAEGEITKARLMHPSAVTHQTDPEQRAVALDVTDLGNGAYDLTLALEEGITPSGQYMLMLLDEAGVPSEATWVLVE